MLPMGTKKPDVDTDNLVQKIEHLRPLPQLSSKNLVVEVGNNDHHERSGLNKSSSLKPKTLNPKPSHCICSFGALSAGAL